MTHIQHGTNWLAHWARTRPDAEALFDVGTGQRWSYSDLYDESVRWAGKLHGHSVGRGDRVAVLAKNRGETLALLFACAELEAILFPMNWRLSKLELLRQLDDAEPKVVFVDGEHQDLLNIPTLRLEDGTGSIRYSNSRIPAPETPWVLCYTSGSSGAPKGAILPRRQLEWNARNTQKACNLAPESSTLTFTPLFHTGGLNCLTTPLFHCGGRVVLTPGFDPGQALDLIADEAVSHLMGVPTIFQMIADQPDFENTSLLSVQDCICGGAPLPISLLERYLSRNIPLRQGFGMTEVGPNCFSLPREQLLQKKGAVGRPIVDAKVVRPDGTECDPGESGELLLSGPVVFGGYWNKPRVTAERLKDGWFHTGDVLYRDEDGFYYVSGRIKEMYISGGENVFPGEVEQALVSCPGVAMAAVVPVPHPQWGEVGNAFVQPAPGCAIDGGEIRIQLTDRIAKYKVPKSVTVLPELPVTGSGKIDKQALKEMSPA